MYVPHCLWIFRANKIYDGEIYDATYTPVRFEAVEVFEGPTDTLIPQQGEEICEQVKLSFAEVKDKAGNFYTENYRGALKRQSLRTLQPSWCIPGWNGSVICDPPTRF